MSSLSVQEVASQLPAEMWLQESFQETRIQEGGGGTGILPLRVVRGCKPAADLHPPLGPGGFTQFPQGLQSAHQTAGLHCRGRWCSPVCFSDVIIRSERRDGQVLTPCQFTGCSFGSAAIWQYESVKFRVQSFFDEIRADWLEKLHPQKRGDIRKEVRRMKDEADLISRSLFLVLMSYSMWGETEGGGAIAYCCLYFRSTSGGTTWVRASGQSQVRWLTPEHAHSHRAAILTYLSASPFFSQGSLLLML